MGMETKGTAGKRERLERAIVGIGSVVHGTEQLLDDMEERWCTDGRYYAFLALVRTLRDLADEASDAAEALGGGHGRGDR